MYYFISATLVHWWDQMLRLWLFPSLCAILQAPSCLLDLGKGYILTVCPCHKAVPLSCGTASTKSNDSHGSLMTPPVGHCLDRRGSSLHWRLHALLVGSTAMLANLETPSLLTRCRTHFVVTRDSGRPHLRGIDYLNLKSEGLFNYLGESNTRGRCEYNILSSFCMDTLFGVCKQISWVLCLL